MNIRVNPDFLGQVRAAGIAGVADASQHMVDTARRIMDRSGSGQQHPRLARQSSAPGEAPVSQSGEFADALSPVEPDASTDAGSVLGGFSVQETPTRSRSWLIWYEFGTASMRPRPLVGPTLDQAMPGVLAALERRL